MDLPRPISVCQHLPAETQPFHVWFIGHGVDSHWVCDACAKDYPHLPELVPLPDETFATHRQEKDPFDSHGILGTPGIRERDDGLRIVTERFPLPLQEELVTPWLDVQPDLQAPGQWFLLLRSGEIAVFHPREQKFRILYCLKPGFVPDDETALHVDSSNTYGAVCQCKGSLACVFDMHTGAVLKQIDRQNYHPEQCRFPLAFFADPSGRPLLVSATDWNVLEIIDPSDGSVLTSRSFDEPRVEGGRSSLDYFHAGLCVSPGGSRIADSGWIWHPVGVVRAWNLTNWLKNPRESEDGDSVRTTAIRTYFWDGPLCWIDDSTLAVWGWGGDEKHLIPAACLFDAAAGKDLHWFPGPEALRTDFDQRKHQPPTLFFDQYLFSVHDQHGLAVWDVADGSRLLHEPGLSPLHYHPGSKEFVSISGETVTLSRLVK
ncbi:hypothetical protein [Luteolibacter sp. Populi]|uniref:hypothetical protein n=1 Tax=Luteolibacter sp. Populi TaxID=3230487 RepID=UPI0034660FEB